MSGVFVCVVGPSGAGKDTLIRYAETRLGQDPDVLFVRRLVTRASGTFEEHDSLSETAFTDGVARKAFALAWRAHGLGYAVPVSALAAVERGAVAVCNLSRSAVAEARRVFSRVEAVLVTASADVIAARLAARGRESMAAVEERLRREVAGDFSPNAIIVNDGPIAAGGNALVDIVTGLQQQCAASAKAIGVTNR
jgi:ribose 1,5-bisphosphokinase